MVVNAKTPLGEKNTHIVYNIPCKCKQYAYTGESDRKWITRKKEHEDKVRLTHEDLNAGNTDKAAKRMNDKDGGLAKHSSGCDAGIDWQNARIVGKEKNWTQRKYLEGVETLKQKSKGIIPLNNYNQLEHWQGTIYSFQKK